MDSNELNKIAGATIGALLVFLLLGFFSSQIFGTGTHHGHEVQAFALEIEEPESGGEAEEVDLAALVAGADVARGEKLFAKCKSCHKLEKGANATGPYLYGVVGRQIAAVDGFGYSAALQGLEGEWDLEHLSAFLEKPSAYAPGTTMSFAGFPDAADRVNLIAYLNENSDAPVDLAAGLAPAEEAAAEEAAAEETATEEAATEEAATEEATVEEAATEEAATEEAAAATEQPAAETAAAEAPAGDSPFAPLLAAADAKAGEAVFRRCKACHKLEDGKNGVGPTLWGVVGRPVAAVPGFRYSDAFKSHGGTWDLATLDAYLADPKGYIPGNKMAFAGLKDAQDRINVITYMNEADGSPEPLQ